MVIFHSVHCPSTLLAFFAFVKRNKCILTNFHLRASVLEIFWAICLECLGSYFCPLVLWLPLFIYFCHSGHNSNIPFSENSSQMTLIVVLSKLDSPLWNIIILSCLDHLTFSKIVWFIYAYLFFSSAPTLCPLGCAFSSKIKASWDLRTMHLVVTIVSPVFKALPGTE